MKKTLVAAAATLACASAFSQVTLYGLADVGITRVTGYAQGSVTQLNSGIMEGSRWGIKGEEDMGGGFKALFTLESRVELDTGGLGNRPTSGNQLPDRLTAGLPGAVAAGLTNTAIGPSLGVNLGNTAFDRQAWLGLVTPVGGFLMGRQYTPAFEALATFDIMNTQSALSAGQVASIPAGVDIRYNNTLQYRIVQGPWNAALMYGFGEEANSSSNRLLGINTLYKSSAFSAGFGYNTKKNSTGQQALKTTVVGASATQGGWTLSGMVARIEEPNPSQGPELSAGLTALGAGALVPAVLDRLKQDANLVHIGLRYNLGAAGQVTVAYNKLNDKRAANADTASYGVAYMYPLSKRTNLNAVLTRFSNSGTGQAAPGGNGYLGGVTGVAGQDSTSLALGVRHTF
jgi:predicted porin